jgi:2,3,4,5-tetrahydropyridine-2-carboxylate N-succinyltransferase
MNAVPRPPAPTPASATPASAQLSPLPGTIDELWERRSELGPQDAAARSDVVAAVDSIDAGRSRVAWADPATGEIVVDERARRAILLAFRLLPMVASQVGDFRYHDRVPLTSHLDGVRAVAGSIVRWGAYVAPGAVLMPSFVNIGAYVDSGTMVDTWATVGSCAQIGKNVHLSGGVGIGGVLEPLQAAPTIIEDNCFIGARAEVAEGVIVGEGSVLSMGVYLGQSTKIVDRQTGFVHQGRVPPYSVVVSGTMPGKPLSDGSPSPSLYCAVIVKTVDEKTRAKTSINELLRD